MIEENRQEIAAMRRVARQLGAADGGVLSAVVSRVAVRLVERAEELARIAARNQTEAMTVPMIAEGIRNVAEPWCNAAAVERFRKRELVGEGLRAVLPEVVFANLAGNLFVSAWETVLQCWALGAGVVARLPAGGDCLLPLLREVAGEVDARVGGMLLFEHWPAGELDRTREVVLLCDAGVVFGGDEAVGVLNGLMPWRMPRRLHGGAVSFAVVDAADAGLDLAQAVAYDVAVYDQSGCLSPRLIFFVGEWREAVGFAELVMGEMRALAGRLPRRNLDLAERAAVARDRDAVLLASALGARATVVSGVEEPFLVTVRAGVHGVGERLVQSMRHVGMAVVPDLAEVVEDLAGDRGRVSTLGVSEGVWRRRAVFDEFDPVRICTAGQMQRPGLGWIHDGQRPLGGLVRWVERE